MSCKGIKLASPNSASGIYPIDPDANGPKPPALVYCDMTTDGGGWTLVASTRTNTLDDQASPYYDDLQTTSPAAPHAGVWSGMRPLAAGNSDNINNMSLPANDQWAAGFLEGEDFCDAADDFTVDFDDRGMDNNESDGTDWGEDDTTKKCGMSGLNDGAWHIWVREL